MSLDGAFLHGAMNEMLDRKLIGGRVDKIHQPSREEIIVTIRTFGGAEKNTVFSKFSLCESQPH